MDNPCISCSLSQNEKASCCGCPPRLEWERKKKKEMETLTKRDLSENDLLRRGAVLRTVENMYKACDGNIKDFYDLLIESFNVLPPHVED